jgi:hypothetical protein
MLLEPGKTTVPWAWLSAGMSINSVLNMQDGYQASDK